MYGCRHPRRARSHIGPSDHRPPGFLLIASLHLVYLLVLLLLTFNFSCNTTYRVPECIQRTLQNLKVIFFCFVVQYRIFLVAHQERTGWCELIFILFIFSLGCLKFNCIIYMKVHQMHSLTRILWNLLACNSRPVNVRNDLLLDQINAKI